MLLQATSTARPRRTGEESQGMGGRRASQITGRLVQVTCCAWQRMNTWRRPTHSWTAALPSPEMPWHVRHRSTSSLSRVHCCTPALVECRPIRSGTAITCRYGPFCGGRSHPGAAHLPGRRLLDGDQEMMRRRSTFATTLRQACGSAQALMILKNWWSKLPTKQRHQWTGHAGRRLSRDNGKAQPQTYGDTSRPSCESVPGSLCRRSAPGGPRSDASDEQPRRPELVRSLNKTNLNRPESARSGCPMAHGAQTGRSGSRTCGQSRRTNTRTNTSRPRKPEKRFCAS